MSNSTDLSLAVELAGELSSRGITPLLIGAAALTEAALDALERQTLTRTSDLSQLSETDALPLMGLGAHRRRRTLE